MTDHPISFNAAMVRALLDGWKTMTRRIIKPQPVPWRYPPEDGGHECEVTAARIEGEPERIALGRVITGQRVAKWAIGDTLWVQEKFVLTTHGNPVFAADYRDSRGDFWSSIANDPSGLPWRGSTQMPRLHSRITLRVTGLRVERVQEISEEDARAEGVLYVPGHGEITWFDLMSDLGWSNYLNCRMGFEVLWNSLYGPDAWAANEWVSVTSFERIEG